MLTKHGKNVIVRNADDHHCVQENPYLIFLISDMHWDNPKCRRDLLIRDLDLAKKKGARIIFNGDNFCLMQGKYDPRRAKADIRPEHNKANYLDAVIEDAASFFGPYAENIDFFGYGNHETSIIKHLETDPLQRFVAILNHQQKTNVQVGGYGGWYITRFTDKHKLGRYGSYKMKYFHGSGGGGPVTKGTIQANRRSTMTDGADAIWMGHVHEDYEVTYMKEYVGQGANYVVKQRQELHIRTATYKDEYEDNAFGWANEKGMPPKPLGGRWLELHPHRTQVDGRDKFVVPARSFKSIRA
jgi:hypothetical protein